MNLRALPVIALSITTLLSSCKSREFNDSAAKTDGAAAERGSLFVAAASGGKNSNCLYAGRTSSSDGTIQWPLYRLVDRESGEPLGPVSHDEIPESPEAEACLTGNCSGGAALNLSEESLSSSFRRGVRQHVVTFAGGAGAFALFLLLIGPSGPDISKRDAILLAGSSAGLAGALQKKLEEVLDAGKGASKKPGDAPSGMSLTGDAQEGETEEPKFTLDPEVFKKIGPVSCEPTSETETRPAEFMDSLTSDEGTAYDAAAGKWKELGAEVGAASASECKPTLSAEAVCQDFLVRK
jgi:hypothetical protein